MIKTQHPNSRVWGGCRERKKRQDNHRRDVKFDFLPRYRRGGRRHHSSKAQGIAWLGGGTTLLGGATLRQMDFGDADLINQEAILERPWICGLHTFTGSDTLILQRAELSQVVGTWWRERGVRCRTGGPLSSLEEMGCFQD